jgi:hypothetical protein
MCTHARLLCYKLHMTWYITAWMMVKYKSWRVFVAHWWQLHFAAFCYSHMQRSFLLYIMIKRCIVKHTCDRDSMGPAASDTNCSHLYPRVDLRVSVCLYACMCCGMISASSVLQDCCTHQRHTWYLADCHTMTPKIRSRYVHSEALVECVSSVSQLSVVFTHRCMHAPSPAVNSTIFLFLYTICYFMGRLRKG